ncbi:MAG: hypothetical protein WBP25_04035, partial [Giesbergeria sp.]
KWPRNQPYGPKGRCLAHRICELAPLGAISTLKVALSRASLALSQQALAAIFFAALPAIFFAALLSFRGVEFFLGCDI